jgi:hypothetical protein
MAPPEDALFRCAPEGNLRAAVEKEHVKQR